MAQYVLCDKLSIFLLQCVDLKLELADFHVELKLLRLFLLGQRNILSGMIYYVIVIVIVIVNLF